MNPEELERNAEQIRADLDRTLNALERKLSPSQLLDRSLAYLRDHSGDLTRSVGEAVRRNPVPIVLAVAGIGWLRLCAAGSRSTTTRSATNRRMRILRSAADSHGRRMQPVNGRVALNTRSSPRSSVSRSCWEALPWRWVRCSAR